FCARDNCFSSLLVAKKVSGISEIHPLQEPITSVTWHIDYTSPLPLLLRRLLPNDHPNFLDRLADHLFDDEFDALFFQEDLFSFARESAELFDDQKRHRLVRGDIDLERHI